MYNANCDRTLRKGHFQDVQSLFFFWNDGKLLKECSALRSTLEGGVFKHCNWSLNLTQFVSTTYVDVVSPKSNHIEGFWSWKTTHSWQEIVNCTTCLTLKSPQTPHHVWWHYAQGRNSECLLHPTPPHPTPTPRGQGLHTMLQRMCWWARLYTPKYKSRSIFPDTFHQILK